MTKGRAPALTIAPEKVIAYLLNVDHVEGGSKARWFIARGFRVDDPEGLAIFLANHAFVHWPGDVIDAPPHGVKHRIIGPLICPDRSAPIVLAIWLVEPGEATARLITARPYGRNG